MHAEGTSVESRSVYQSSPDDYVPPRIKVDYARQLPFQSFLGAFAKFLKETISFVMSVCPSAWNNSAPTGRIFMKLDI